MFTKKNLFINYKICAIMKSLKELNEKCNLIAEFRNPAFIGKTSEECYVYTRMTKCAIYTNNKGKYYVYKFINKAIIDEYDNYEIAAERFTTFIELIIER